MTDAQGRHYVLLEYSEGHGTNAGTDYLTIYELTDKLAERKRLTLSEGIGPTSRWVYDYIVTTPKTGGVSLMMTLQVGGTPDPGVALPDKTKIVRIDTPQ